MASPAAAPKPLEELATGDRVRVQGGRNFEKFHGGMEGTIIENVVDSKNMKIQFDDKSEPLSVAYRHLEFAPNRGGYRAGHGSGGGGPAKEQGPKEPEGPMLTEHEEYTTRQLVRLHSLQGAAELNGKLARLRKFDVNAERWEIDVRETGERKRLKEANLGPPGDIVVPDGLSVEEYKARGNEFFKVKELEQAVAFYGAAIRLVDNDDAEEGAPKPPEAGDPKYVAVLYGNRSQCFINLCREVHGEDKAVAKETRLHAMRANMDSARAIELDPANGKAYYRRGCAVLGMAPSASRAKEAIHYLETALTGRSSGAADSGMVLPNAMRNEVTQLLEYAKRRLDDCTETHCPDIEQCRENCKQQ